MILIKLVSLGSSEQIVTSIVTIVLTAFITFYFAKKGHSYQKLFDRKLIVVETIFEKIVALERELKNHIYLHGPVPPPNGQVSQGLHRIHVKFTELHDYFLRKEIVLDDGSIAIIEEIIKICNRAFADITAADISNKVGDPTTAFNQWKQSEKLMTEKLNAAKKQLREDFVKVFNAN